VDERIRDARRRARHRPIWRPAPAAGDRALLVDPCLLILEDSTSAVDAKTEAAIREALERLIRARRRTLFVIAQRISTVRDADLILVLDDGGVAAQGRHKDLLRDSELYNLGSQLRQDPVATAA